MWLFQINYVPLPPLIFLLWRERNFYLTILIFCRGLSIYNFIRLIGTLTGIVDNCSLFYFLLVIFIGVRAYILKCLPTNTSRYKRFFQLVYKFLFCFLV